MADSLVKAVRTIGCPVCGAENTFLSTRCSSCGAFIQDRVPKLDLFQSIYGIFESPSRVFVRVARSEQKNYVYTLFAFAGFAIAAVIAMVGRVGNLPINFIYITALFLVAAPMIGLAFLSIVSVAVWWWNWRIWRVQIPYRVTAALIAYALVPVVLSVFLVLPVEFALFGSILFSNNPSPAFYKPAVFFILTGIDLLALLWSLILYHTAFSNVYTLSRTKNVLTVTVILILAGGLMYSAGLLLRFLLNI